METLIDGLVNLVPSRNEKLFQDEIEQYFLNSGFTYQREVECENGIVDFTVSFDEGCLAVEVKTQGSENAALQQCAGYLNDKRFDVVLLVAAKPWKKQVIDLDEKTIIVLPVWRSAL